MKAPIVEGRIDVSRNKIQEVSAVISISCRRPVVAVGAGAVQGARVDVPAI